MESPLDILSRAAGMVSSERVMKRKIAPPPYNGRGGGGGGGGSASGGAELDEDQPLDFSCKKKRQSNSDCDIAPTTKAPIISARNGHPSASLLSHQEQSQPLTLSSLPPIIPIPQQIKSSNNRSSSTDSDYHRPSVIAFAKNPQHQSELLKRRLQIQRQRNMSSSSTTSEEDNNKPSNNGIKGAKFVKRKSRKKNGKNIEVEKGRRIVVITSKEDDIDEHFRRSLGEDFDKLNKKNNTPSAAANGKDSGGGGNKKKKISEENNTGGGGVGGQRIVLDNNGQQEGQQLSVDDHFAKALGSETWSRITSSKRKAAASSSESSVAVVAAKKFVPNPTDS